MNPEQPEQLELRLYPEELDVEGLYDRRYPIKYLGKARRRNDGKWVCLANVDGSFCLVEVTVTPTSKMSA